MLHKDGCGIPFQFWSVSWHISITSKNGGWQMSIEVRPQRRSLDLEAISTALAKAIAGAIPLLMVADPATAAGIASNVLGALTELVPAVRSRRRDTLTQVGWEIARAAYAAGLARFFAKVELARRPEGKELREIIKRLIVRSTILAEQSPSVLSLDHILAPLKISIFRDAAKRLPHDLKPFGPTSSPSDLRRLFEESLAIGLKDVRDREPDRFRLFEDALSGSFAGTLERRAAVVRHEEYLIRGFTQQPVFGQEDTGITLSDLYVRQRCLWSTKEPLGDSDPSADNPEARAHVFQNLHKKDSKWTRVLHLGDLHATVSRWLADKQPQDSVRVVAGGPGSGKSTFAKALSIEVIDAGEYDVLFVPLQDIDATGNFETRIANLYKTRTDLGFDRVDSPLQWMGKTEITGSPPSSPLLLICDGLDEIAPPDSAEAANVTTDFIQALNHWLAQRNSAGCYARAVVLGRTIAAEEAFRKLAIDDAALLRVAGFLPLSSIPEWDRKAHEGLTRDPDGRAAHDQRITYWENWCLANDHPNAALPIALGTGTGPAKALEELTTEPLLLYLLIWTGYLGDRWQEAAENRNVVYKEIFSRIYQRDWGSRSTGRSRSNRQKGGHSGTKHISEDEFFSLQEALGLASWPNGGRTVTTNAFISILRVFLDPDQLDDVTSNPNLSLKSVALQSYTRSASDETGYEFVHKTLGEYLIASGLVTTAQRATHHLRDRTNEGRCKKAALEISRIAYRGPLTAEIHRFFNDEVRLRYASLVPARSVLETALTPLLNWMLRNGLPVHVCFPMSDETSFANLDQAERRALDVLWSFSQSLARLAYPFGPSTSRNAGTRWAPGPVKLSWPTPQSFATLFYRVSDRAHVSDTNRLCSFDFLDFTGQGLTEISFGSVLYEGVHPKRWLSLSARGCKFIDAGFFACLLREADLAGSELRHAQLSLAQITAGDLRSAIIEDSNAEGANLGGVNLTDAHLSSVSLNAANLRGANLSGAVLRDIAFGFPYAYPRHWGERPTDLTNANLSAANLKSCDFEFAVLDNANFTGADLEQADLSLASLSQANFKDAFMRGTKVAEDVLPQLDLSQKQRAEIEILGKVQLEARRNELTSPERRHSRTSKRRRT